MAACCGIPVALLWLLFLFNILKKKDDFESVAVQFSVITGFMMGMAEAINRVSFGNCLFSGLCFSNTVITYQ